MNEWDFRAEVTTIFLWNFITFRINDDRITKQNVTFAYHILKKGYGIYWINQSEWFKKWRPIVFCSIFCLWILPVLAIPGILRWFLYWSSKRQYCNVLRRLQRNGRVWVIIHQVSSESAKSYKLVGNNFTDLTPSTNKLHPSPPAYLMRNENDACDYQNVICQFMG